MSISLVGESFLLLELLFSHMILICKGIYLTCKGKHTKKVATFSQDTIIKYV